MSAAESDVLEIPKWLRPHLMAELQSLWEQGSRFFTWPEYLAKALKTTTSFVYPPIPIRNFDWCAYFDPEAKVGYGASESLAIDDLLENME